MATYQISFFKSLLSADGHPFRCLQDQLKIQNARSPSQAAARAERQFEILHQIPKWNLRADSVDVCEVRKSASKMPIGAPAKKRYPRDRISGVGRQR